MVKLWKLQERQEVIPLPDGLITYSPLPFCGDRGRPLQIGGWRGRTYQVGTHPGLHDGDRGPGIAFSQRVSGCRKSDLEDSVAGPFEVLRRRARDARRNRPSTRPQGARRGGNCRSAGHHLGWYRRLVARKFDGSCARRAPGRPPIGKEIEELIIRMAKENRSWGYDRIVGAVANLGHQVSDQTVGNVL